MFDWGFAFFNEKVTNGIQAERVDYLVRVDDVAEALGHLDACHGDEGKGLGVEVGCAPSCRLTASDRAR